VGSQPYSVAIGDFNNDGKQDIAVANSGNTNDVSIRLGDGAGGFTGSTQVGVSFAVHKVAIGDFNNDGKQGFATANFNDNTVTIALGQCNTAPVISAVGVTRTVGGTGSNSTIAQIISDGQQAPNTLTLTVSGADASGSNNVTTKWSDHQQPRCGWLRRGHRRCCGGLRCFYADR
jgi:hypothetical protein